ncbi:MAGUK p55 subfamily member 2 [Hypsibius exemplaris]|uniref:MAGUK p55 subfamily member 2 n=1 Tax=Hypsibius exemplaris TaxID=2072580 RepID=A0A1W0X3L1_HYPEX|nr:MAGUK p55 subfamily member 2 [Hypsibius exemplaris]
MDEAVLQRISTSMSVDNLQLASSRKLLLPEELVAAEPVGGDNVELLLEIVDDLQERVDHGHDSGEVEDHPSDVEELLEILLNFDFQALIEAHDLVANKTTEQFSHAGEGVLAEVAQSQDQIIANKQAPVSGRSNGLLHHSNSEDQDCLVRMVSLHRDRGPSSDLGMTVRCENGKLVVARIMIGGLVDKQGMLHIGDVITQVNGVPVDTVPALQAAVQAQMDTLTFTIIPSWIDHPKPLPTYMKAFFYYDPQYDRLLPSRSIGLAFAKGDILEVYSVNDDKFWQARHLGATGAARLIPSLDLQEIRSSRIRAPPISVNPAKQKKSCDFLSLRRRKKLIYGDQLETIDIDKNELILYEEVIRVPAFTRKSILFLGPCGPSRRKLISELIRMYPDRYGYPVPHTSRPQRTGEVNGKQYFFSSVQEMRGDITANRYVEHGEYNGNLYGTKLETVRSVVRSGKICLLDCGPQCLKMMRTREFLPYVVFVTPTTYPAEENGAIFGGTLRSCTMENLKQAAKKEHLSLGIVHTETEADILHRVYEPYFDLPLEMESFELAMCTLLRALEKSESQDQWIPASWIY